jgi:hypothetical protein
VNDTGKVVRIALASGAVNDMATGQVHPQTVAIDATNVYWTTFGSGAGNGTVMACAKSGCAAPAMLHGTLQIPAAIQYGLPTGLVADGTYVYFADLSSGGVVRRVRGAGGAEVVLLGSLDAPGSLALNGTTLTLLTWFSGGQVQRMDVGASSASLLAAGQSFAVSVASTDTDVYWTVYSPHSSGGGQVFKCPTTGCIPGGAQVFAQNVQPAHGIVVDTSSVYWLSNDGVVYKAPR